MRGKLAVLGAALAAASVAAPLTADAAQTTRVKQDAAIGGQQNRDWGRVASNIAQLDYIPDATNGGAMGQHSRSTRAADINGGFASSDNAFGITFNTDGGRQGVGNVSADVNGPHQLAPGDGGNGHHAVNNAGLSSIINPVDGQLTTTVGGSSPDVSSQLLDGTTGQP